MTQDTDPVRNGFVISLARPGGNITGLSRLAPELSGKQVELLKEIIPGISRLAVLKSADLPAIVEALRKIELAAGAYFKSLMSEVRRISNLRLELQPRSGLMQPLC